MAVKPIQRADDVQPITSCMREKFIVRYNVLYIMYNLEQHNNYNNNNNNKNYNNNNNVNK